MSQQVTHLLKEIEKYFQILAKSRAIQISTEKKIIQKIAEARQAMK
ncbi:hypothetical protein O0550_12115 [Brevibacillus halotolerans]|nr:MULTISPECIES: hypothetical protein [Brevibacillus]MCR8963939.1 hypothetical protein [Brevibacillus laterosporus]MCZ0836094.1 hypothetical protein [Brevibacillus halotolerans]